jgi:hypothetical protein
MTDWPHAEVVAELVLELGEFDADDVELGMGEVELAIEDVAATVALGN